MPGYLVVDNDIAVSSNILDCQIVFEVAATRSRSEQNKTRDPSSSKEGSTAVQRIVLKIKSIIGSSLSARDVNTGPGLETEECK